MAAVEDAVEAFEDAVTVTEDELVFVFADFLNLSGAGVDAEVLAQESVRRAVFVAEGLRHVFVDLAIRVLLPRVGLHRQLGEADRVHREQMLHSFGEVRIVDPACLVDLHGYVRHWTPPSYSLPFRAIGICDLRPVGQWSRLDATVAGTPAVTRLTDVSGGEVLPVLCYPCVKVPEEGLEPPTRGL